MGIFIELTSSTHPLWATPSNPPPSPLLTSIFQDIPQARGNHTETPPLNFSALERQVARSRVARYDGSLTTPPCAEGIKWHVVEDPIFVDVGTYRRVKKVIGFNSRYTQNVPGAENLLSLAGKGL
jgi:carbonic anhydrase